MAHWIGKALLTDDEKLAVGILRMLDCGENTAFDKLNARIDRVFNSLTPEEREELRKKLPFRYRDGDIAEDPGGGHSARNRLLGYASPLLPSAHPGFSEDPGWV
jgi:hypothetical protein